MVGLLIGGIRMADQEGKYNIKAAALILGIQPGTLRAWERRYQMIAPIRNEAGHRLYSEEHIKLLKWLIKKVDQGFTISQAISLMGHNHSQMDSEVLNLKQDTPVINLTESLYEALIHFEHEKVNDIINTMFSIFTLEKVILDLFSQVLKKIDDSFKTGKIVHAQKHFSSWLLKARITTIIHSLPSIGHHDKAVCITWSQNSDDVGLLLFTFYLRKRGIEVINIGTYRSEDDIDHIMEMIEPDLVIISCDFHEDINEALLLINKLTMNHRDVTIGLGGKAITTMNQSDLEHYSTLIFGQSINEWETWLLERLVF